MPDNASEGYSRLGLPVNFAEIYDGEDPGLPEVHAICAYLRDKPCDGCADKEVKGADGELYTRACLVLAIEAVRVVDAVRKKRSAEDG